MANSRQQLRTTLIVSLAVFAGLAAGPAGAQVVRQLTDIKTSLPGPPALNDAGTVVFAGSSTNQFGGNPDYSFEIARWDAASGAGALVTNSVPGVTALVSITDDGQWLAFPSPADLAGRNHDQSVELFVMKSDGSTVSQLTDDPSVIAASVTQVVIAGSGNRIVFLANTDPLGLNPDHRTQLFLVNRDGSGLRQLTQFASGSIGSIGISDDGARLSFVYNGDPLGQNADLGDEIFALNYDGTGLRQLTDCAAGYGASSPSLSGNGLKVAFQSDNDFDGSNAAHQDEVFVVNYDGTGRRQLTKTVNLLLPPMTGGPSITDDGLWVFFYSDHTTLFGNLDGNFEIWKIKTDGTGLKALTSSLIDVGSLMPTVAGGGTRVAFYSLANLTGGNPNGEPQLFVMDGNGAGLRQLSNSTLVFLSSPDLSPDGSQVAFIHNDRVLGNNEIWRAKTDGSEVGPVTALASGQANAPRFAADSRTIVFSSDTTATGNSDASEEIFKIDVTGSDLVQLTSGASGATCQNPAVARAASVVVFDCDGDLAGGNPDLSREIFKVNLDGTGLQQLTFGPVGAIADVPRVDETGAWVVFESNADLVAGGNPDGGYEIFRIRTDGMGLEQLTSDALHDSRAPDISGGGGTIVYSSTADPLLLNPEFNSEIFVYEPATAARRQLTAFAKGSSGGPRISGDGRWVYFESSAPVFEDNPNQPVSMFRAPAAGGAIERAGGLQAGFGGGLPLSLGGLPLSLGGGGGAAVSRDGERAVFARTGNITGGNADMLPEICLIDRLAPVRIRPGRTSPTIVSWDVESGPVRYDIARGDVANLRAEGGVVDLGTVSCLENDSPDASTAGFGDPEDPAPGRALFFLYRGAQGLSSPGSYGRSSAGLERTPAAGDCTLH